VDKAKMIRSVALISCGIGAAGSAALMIYAGKRVASPSLLIVLFTVWVVSPFALLGLAIVVSKRWADLTRVTLYRVTPIVSAAALGIYGTSALSAQRPKTAVFVMVAPLSCLFIAIAILTAAFLTRGHTRA
jgi:hypothetical protein